MTDGRHSLQSAAHKGVYPPGETRIWESKENLKNRMEGVIGKYLDYSKLIVAGHGMAFRTLVGEIGEIPHASIIEFSKSDSQQG